MRNNDDSAGSAAVLPDLTSLSAYDYALPPELVAQQPAAERSAARLLDAGDPVHPADRHVRDLPRLLQPGDLLVVNDTRVIKARLYGAKASGGRVEALVERILPGHEVLAHLRASKSPPRGSHIHFAHRDSADTAFSAEVLGRGGVDGGLYHLRLSGEPHALLERHGHVPLPPYIEHADDAADERRYQTLFADKPGAVAAPTASLHFDAPLLAALEACGVERASVTLHVGAGTFLPMRSDDLAAHRMHTEWCDVPVATVDAVARARARGGRVIAVGTTTLRTLEAAALRGSLQAGARETDIFIRPGFRFNVVDALMTNFHLPKSTLMVLVSAFAGHGPVMRLYAHAVAARYRFFSYGDAMLLWRDAHH